MPSPKLVRQACDSISLHQPAAYFTMREKVKTAERAHAPGEAMGRAGIISNETKQPARRCAVTCNPEFAGGAT
jgi:hypothetical protein